MRRRRVLIQKVRKEVRKNEGLLTLPFLRQIRRECEIKIIQSTIELAKRDSHFMCNPFVRSFASLLHPQICFPVRRSELVLRLQLLRSRRSSDPFNSILNTHSIYLEMI